MQMTLDGRTSLERSIDILREYEPDEGYYLAFSGGKDSCVLKHVADMAEVRYDAHYNMTTIDPPEVTRFIKKYHPDVEWHVPEKPFWQMVAERGFPTRRLRWCCAEYKEIGGEDRIVLTGIRAEESRSRAKRGIFAPCTKRRKWFVNPLMEWTSGDIWKHIKRHDLPYCSLYDEGWDRIGCIVCPYERQIEKSMKRWPAHWKLMEKAFHKLYARSETCQDKWGSADEMWQWWLAQDLPYPKNEEDKPPTLPFDDWEVE